MKKRTIVLAYLLLLSLGTILSLYIPKNEVAAKDAIVIPGQAIRLRILANSDLEGDQALKRKVRDAVNAKISVWVQDLTSISDARKVIKSKLPEIQATAEEVVKKEGSKQAVKVKFGKVQFPTKLYGQFLYPAGDYEAILITLGEGKGANWWCVLFPPLCFLDFSNGVAVSKGFEEKKGASTKTESKKADAEQATGVSDAAVTAESESGTNEKAASDEEVSKSKTNEEIADANDPAESNSGAGEKAAETKADAVADTEANDETADASGIKVKSEKSTASVPSRVQKQIHTEEVAQSAALDSSSVKEEDSKQAPVYTSEDEQPVKVKFFIVELWNKIF